MCYTGICEYETYPFGANEGCVCTKPRHTGCPAYEHICELCDGPMHKSLIPSCAGGSHREVDGRYCPKCDRFEPED